METGGGRGDDIAFVTWSKRDPLDFASYVGQDSNLYLTPVYIMDKEAGFLLVEKKEQLPPGCRFEDNVNAATTVDTAGKKKSSDDDKVVSQVKEMLQTMSAARAVESKELREILNGSAEENEETEVIGLIERTTNLINVHETKLSELDVQTQSILNNNGSVSEKKRKLHPVRLEIRTKKQLVLQLNATLAKATSKLSKLNGNDEDGDNNDEDLFDDLSIHST